MNAAGVDRIIVINTLLTSLPGKPASRAMRFFSVDARHNGPRGF